MVLVRRMFIKKFICLPYEGHYSFVSRLILPRDRLPLFCCGRDVGLSLIRLPEGDRCSFSLSFFLRGCGLWYRCDFRLLSTFGSCLLVCLSHLYMVVAILFLSYIHAETAPLCFLVWCLRIVWLLIVPLSFLRVMTGRWHVLFLALLSSIRSLLRPCCLPSGHP